MGRPLKWDTFKKVIKTIRENPTKWKDLKELGIPEKTLQRYLTEYLGENGLNLVKKKEEFWVWTGYEYPREYTLQTYQIATKHAMSLIPAVQPLLNHNPTELLDFREKPQPEKFQIYQTESIPKEKIVQRENFALSEYLEEHLETGYPRAYYYLLSFRKYFLLQDSKAPLALALLEKAKENSKQMGRNPQIPTFKDEQQENVWVDYEKAKYRMLDSYQKLYASLQKIKISVESGGNPLKGRCKICPNIILKQE